MKTRLEQMFLVLSLASVFTLGGCGDESGGSDDFDAWPQDVWWSEDSEPGSEPTIETLLQSLTCANIKHMSQNQTTWACKALGTCYKTTIGKCTGKSPAGCAVTAVAMLLKAKNKYSTVDPSKLNDYLKSKGGYASGCLIYWATAANYDGSGGLVWKGTSSITTVSSLKAKFDSGYLVVSSSKRFSSGHWVTLIGYTGSGTKWSDFKYYDPWDATATVRSLGDGWVGSGASLRLFK